MTVDRAFASYLTNTDITAVIAADDSIPQVGEGTEVLSAALTPKSTTNRIRMRAMLFGATSSNQQVTVALFVNGGTNAVYATGSHTDGAADLEQWTAEWEYVPGSISAQTITVRVGVETGTLRLNGTNTARRYGGVGACTLILEEIKA